MVYRLTTFDVSLRARRKDAIQLFHYFWDSLRFFLLFFWERIPLLSGEVASSSSILCWRPIPKKKTSSKYISHPISLPSTRMNSLSLPPHLLFTERRKRQRNVVRRKKKAKSLRENRGKFSFFFLFFFCDFDVNGEKKKKVSWRWQYEKTKMVGYRTYCWI